VVDDVAWEEAFCGNKGGDCGGCRGVRVVFVWPDHKFGARQVIMNAEARARRIMLATSCDASELSTRGCKMWKMPWRGCSIQQPQRAIVDARAL